MAKADTARKPGLKAARLDLSEQQHEDVKDLASLDGVPMSQFLNRLVQTHIDSNRQRLDQFRSLRGGKGMPKSPKKK